MLNSLDRHRDHLFGHPPARGPGGARRGGRGTPEQSSRAFLLRCEARAAAPTGSREPEGDTQDQPPQVALTANLHNPDYVRVVGRPPGPVCLGRLPGSCDLFRPQPVRLSITTPGTPPCATASASGRRSLVTAQHPRSPHPTHFSAPACRRGSNREAIAEPSSGPTVPPSTKALIGGRIYVVGNLQHGG